MKTYTNFIDSHVRILEFMCFTLGTISIGSLDSISMLLLSLFTSVFLWSIFFGFVTWVLKLWATCFIFDYVWHRSFTFHIILNVLRIRSSIFICISVFGFLHEIRIFGFLTLYEIRHMDIFYIAYLCSSYITLYKHGFDRASLDMWIWYDIPMWGLPFWAQRPLSSLLSSHINRRRATSFSVIPYV